MDLMRPTKEVSEASASEDEEPNGAGQGKKKGKGKTRKPKRQARYFFSDTVSLYIASCEPAGGSYIRRGPSHREKEVL